MSFIQHDIEGPKLKKDSNYVVLVGDVGTGKSTIVEKLTGETNLSSCSQKSYTQKSEIHVLSGVNLVVCDTPGCNSSSDKLSSNLWVAAALNHAPVSKIFIVTKATIRIDNVINNLNKYIESFMRIDEKALGIIVTHMDTVRWSEEELTEIVQNEIGIDDLIFSSSTVKKEGLQDKILHLCSTRFQFKIGSENFENVFNVETVSKAKYMIFVSNEVSNLKKIKTMFDEKRTIFDEELQGELQNAFIVWMEDQIVEILENVEKASKSLSGKRYELYRAGVTKNMEIEMRTVLQDLSIVNEQAENNSKSNASRFHFELCGSGLRITENVVDSLDGPQLDEIKVRSDGEDIGPRHLNAVHHSSSMGASDKTNLMDDAVFVSPTSSISVHHNSVDSDMIVVATSHSSDALTTISISGEHSTHQRTSIGLHLDERPASLDSSSLPSRTNNASAVSIRVASDSGSDRDYVQNESQSEKTSLLSSQPTNQNVIRTGVCMSIGFMTILVGLSLYIALRSSHNDGFPENESK